MRREYVSYPADTPIKITYANIREYPIHWHNSIEILYVLRGSINVTIDTDSFEVLEKELEIINVDESHRIYSDEDNKVLIFHIDPYFFEKYYKDINNIFFYTNSTDDGAQEGEEYDLLRNFLAKLLCEAVQKIDDYDKEIESILIDLLYHLINNFHYLTYEKEELKEKTEQLARYHRISKYIFNNYDSNITLQEIAKKEFLSPHYLSHEIKYATGYSFTDLVNQTRVEESVKLLLDSDLSISDISDEVGFSHVRYLNKNFKNYYGCTPLQYRKKNKLTEKELAAIKNIEILNLEDALEYLSSELDDYERFNYENKLWKIHVNMDDSLGEFNKDYSEVINLDDAFDLLLEDNKDILEEIQEELHFNYVRLENMFNSDMGVFPKADFYNWNKAKSVIEFLDYISLKPLILIDNTNFTFDKYKQVLTSFFEYFSEIDYIDVSEFKFQFTPIISEDIKKSLKSFLDEEYNLDVIENDFICDKSLNKIYDTAYMLPYIIHNTLFNKNSLSFLRAFDVLEKEISLTNEVFIGAPGLVNDMGIRKPSYYAYYLLSKLGNEIVAMENGYIVTKKDDEYCILLYSYNDELNDMQNFEDIFTKRGKRKIYKRKISLNIENIKKSSRIITYEISERVGSSYNYWLSMGSPDRLNKEEKEILHKASFPKIEFKYSKKNTILNIITELRGYAAKLILIKNIK
ncbi:helix-turn-helix domain-containing protein [Clostridium tertium]|jgi:AraC-like DNA-binding protein/beta-xylosidase|uniref:helix-turn-helix domain-containing protein n=1 Tax=Clostridium TaxID=1485 RepID=UPI001159B6CA|nr:MULTISPECIES: helix-turn-helix domain-containing protein [Clostridium]MBU6136676.1 helix-turn-helix domain-containing protein [Clostridium tertium]MDB1921442.1 helix-turn-helix domain-containing protein [Clostridium tertium]MDB1924686.1 helix-turn-helix domain-containing protein [Clostridium tertium]MDB1928214.1 helix-turn-helix domain-containing protein [Clostridium tertium]MDU1568091.1 helix-turn-helix domain-containing protein [Clostridium sp.]